MTTRKQVKFLHEGKYAAEVTVELLDTEAGWSPYLSLDDAMKLDDIREALKRGDVATAEKQARVFELTPVHA